MQISLLPKLTEARKAEVKTWVEATLVYEELSSPDIFFPLDNQVAIYVDGRIKALRRNEYWQDDGSGVIYVGWSTGRAGRNYLSMLDRLAVIGAIISLADLWEELHEAYIARAATVLISSYTGIMSGMIQTEAAITGLAFNADRSVVAGKIGDCYHLPDGTAVEVDDTWTIVPDRPGVRPVVTAG